LQKDCELENLENEEEQERLQGTAVQYGQKVQVYVIVAFCLGMYAYVYSSFSEQPVIVSDVYRMVINTNSGSIS